MQLQEMKDPILRHLINDKKKIIEPFHTEETPGVAKSIDSNNDSTS